MTAPNPRTLYDKIWDAHVVDRLGGRTCVIYVDRHLLDEVHSPQAFDGLRRAGRPVRRPASTLAVVDHNVPTENRRGGVTDPKSRAQIQALETNAASFGIPYIPLLDERQGIVHVIGPELGFSLPGQTIVTGDSHASTHGALGALALGVGASEVEQILATQTLVQERARSMKIEATGTLPIGTSAKDLALAIIHRIRAGGAIGHAIEFTGEAVSSLSMEGRMTLCNMAIETGARTGLIAPDEATIAYVRGREWAPKNDALDRAMAWWRTLRSDAGAAWDRIDEIDASGISPMVTWGTNPEAVMPITGTVPDPADESDVRRRTQAQRMLEYMGLTPGQSLVGLKIDVVSSGHARTDAWKIFASPPVPSEGGEWRQECGLWSCQAPAWSSARRRMKDFTGFSERPASNGVSPDAPCVWE